MANEGFNGSTLTFNGAVTPLVSVDYQETAAAINVTGNTDTMHSYVAGLPDITVTVEVVGISALLIGAASALAITWFDGETEAISDVILVDKGRGGSLDDKLSTSLTFRPGSGVGSGS